MEKYYFKYKNDVFRFVLSIVKDKYLAEDITQECFLKLFENQKNIRDFSKIKTWLFTTARNLSITSLNKKPFLELDDKTLPEESNDDFKYINFGFIMYNLKQLRADKQDDKIITDLKSKP